MLTHSTFLQITRKVESIGLLLSNSTEYIRVGILVSDLCTSFLSFVLACILNRVQCPADRDIIHLVL